MYTVNKKSPISLLVGDMAHLRAFFTDSYQKPGTWEFLIFLTICSSIKTEISNDNDFGQKFFKIFIQRKIKI